MSKLETRPESVDYTWKIVLGGEGGVGKTTLLHRYISGEFKQDTTMTIGTSHQSVFVEKYGLKINCVFWDLGGQKRFDVLHPAYVGQATGAFICFDMSDVRTLEMVEKWIHLLRNHNSPFIPLILVGTKFDLVNDKVELDRQYKVADEIVQGYNLNAFIVTSSKLNFNIDSAIGYMIDYLAWQASQGNL